ncbi:hypothetical protein ACW9H6_11855 [Pseudomonas sp. SDO528_S397]
MFKLFLFILMVNISSSVIAGNATSDTYEVDSETQGLRASWPGGSLLVKGVVGNQGQNTRTLMSFNGKRVLHYENLASRIPFEAYFTVERHSSKLVVDCIYVDTRSEQNGVLVNKAVCGLNKALVKNYAEMVYEFSDIWKDDAAVVDIGPVLEVPSATLQVVESSFNDIKVVRIYNSKACLAYHSPETLVKDESSVRPFGLNKVFTVFDVADLSTPIRIEVASEDMSKPFHKFGYKALSELLSK